ncbi:MAG: D-alanine--D-alanine ligase [Gemmatimonadota bacterium]|nr:MAG: D-alanine--D-alanine ligase [Gemmatimonadota bacterium]
MRIAVLMGGTSTERDVSLASGRAVARWLQKAGHQVIEIDAAFGANRQDNISPHVRGSIQRRPPKPDELSAYGHRRVFESVHDLITRKIDAVFIALHGVPGEDGTVQGMLELAGLPYTGSGVLGSTLAMDKIISKKLFEKDGIQTPAWFSLTADVGAGHQEIQSRIESTFGFPVVVKPNNQGSTVGLSIVHQPSDLEAAFREVRSYSEEILLEQYIAGRELTVSLLGKEALPVIEIHPEHGVYDYECKYTKGKSTYTVPAELSEKVLLQIQKMGVKAFESLKCDGFGRVDIRLDENNEPFCLEVNTIPGMTETSLVPKAAMAQGISPPDLVDEILRLALERHNLGSDQGEPWHSDYSIH